jgi:putative spermidine/putrescine transport system ATP-binding protein
MSPPKPQPVPTANPAARTAFPARRSDVVVPLGVRRAVSTGDRVDFAIRRRRCRSGAARDWRRHERAKVPSRVRAIEYQGSFVKVILDKIGDDELIAYVPDRVFYRDPFSIGDVVIAGWEKDKTRMLARN